MEREGSWWVQRTGRRVRVMGEAGEVEPVLFGYLKIVMLTPAFDRMFKQFMSTGRSWPMARI